LSSEVRMRRREMEARCWAFWGSFALRRSGSSASVGCHGGHCSTNKTPPEVPTGLCANHRPICQSSDSSSSDSSSSSSISVGSPPMPPFFHQPIIISFISWRCSGVSTFFMSFIA